MQHLYYDKVKAQAIIYQKLISIGYFDQKCIIYNIFS